MNLLGGFLDDAQESLQQLSSDRGQVKYLLIEEPLLAGLTEQILVIGNTLFV